MGMLIYYNVISILCIFCRILFHFLQLFCIFHPGPCKHLSIWPSDHVTMWASNHLSMRASKHLSMGNSDSLLQDIIFHWETEKYRGDFEIEWRRDITISNSSYKAGQNNPVFFWEGWGSLKGLFKAVQVAMISWCVSFVQACQNVS